MPKLQLSDGYRTEPLDDRDNDEESYEIHPAFFEAGDEDPATLSERTGPVSELATFDFEEPEEAQL